MEVRQNFCFPQTKTNRGDVNVNIYIYNAISTKENFRFYWNKYREYKFWMQDKNLRKICEMV